MSIACLLTRHLARSIQLRAVACVFICLSVRHSVCTLYMYTFYHIMHDLPLIDMWITEARSLTCVSHDKMHLLCT